MADNKETDQKQELTGWYNYYWKTYNYTNKTHAQMVDEHPYVTKPGKSASK